MSSETKALVIVPVLVASAVIGLALIANASAETPKARSSGSPFSSMFGSSLQTVNGILPSILENRTDSHMTGLTYTNRNALSALERENPAASQAVALAHSKLTDVFPNCRYAVSVVDLDGQGKVIDVTTRYTGSDTNTDEIMERLYEAGWAIRQETGQVVFFTLEFA